jgi:hypothetical protein
LELPVRGNGIGRVATDLDEVGDQLLEILGIDARVSQPCVPTDHPRISIQHYDAEKVEHDMANILQRHGYGFRIGSRNDSNERLFWVKRDKPQT